MAKFMIIGIDDPYDKTPLQPDIPGSSGAKIWSMTGLSMMQYSLHFDRRNIFVDDENHSFSNARLRAGRILANVAADYRYTDTFILCLGRIVASGFGLTYTPELSFKKVRHNVFAAYVPHTSGLNRWYNSTENTVRANDFMRVVGAAASGEIADDDIRSALSVPEPVLLR